jgi:hypothetical protein
VSTHSATKSAKTWDLMAFRGANEIVSPMISTTHFAILLEWFGRGAPILPTVVASPTPGVVASAHLLVEVGSTVAAVVLVAKATWGCRRCIPHAPGVDRGFPHESGSRGAMLRGVPLPSRGRAFGPSDRDILQEILELSLDTSPLGGGWLRHCSELYCCCSQVLADPTGSRG